MHSKGFSAEIAIRPTKRDSCLFEELHGEIWLGGFVNKLISHNQKHTQNKRKDNYAFMRVADINIRTTAICSLYCVYCTTNNRIYRDEYS